MSHTSDRSTCKGSDLFTGMFLDSVIEQKFQMHTDMLEYTFVMDSRDSNINECIFFIISIDESLNKITQKGQMDLIARYFDASINSDITHYLHKPYLN